MNISRTDDSLFAQWWFTVDRVLLTAIFVLIGGGLVLSLAASPAMALKRGLPVFYFAQRHALFALVSIGIVVLLSAIAPRSARRLCLVLLAAALAMMLAVLWIGPEINGARRWLRIAGYSFQPSELAKPAFIVVSAWLFAESQQRPNMPAVPLAIALYAALAASAGAGARYRPDAADLDRLGRVVLHFGHAADLGGGLPGARRRGVDGGLCELRACPRPHRPLPQSRHG